MPCVLKPRAALCALFWSAAAVAQPCADIEDGGAAVTVCDIDARQYAIRLFLRDADGGLYGGFPALAGALAAKGETLAFAMNAGMYAPDYAPVGLYVEAGRMLRAADTGAGEGNFHMKPNGVFWVDGARAGVTETGRFLTARARPAYATQSGPMLVIGGRLNPHIHETGASEKFRNGVCVTGGHVAHFAISNQPVTFYRFATLFRDRLKCSDALFLDGGTASALYAPSLGRRDLFHPMGPMIGATAK